MPGQIEGRVVSYGPEGNLVTDISHGQLAGVPRDLTVRICCDEHETIGLFPPDHGQPPFSFLALLAASGFLELTIVGDSARDMLGVAIGEKVIVTW